MINYSELLNTTETSTFIEGCKPISSEDLIKSGKPLHIVECNEWEYNKKTCYSVKFKEYNGYYHNAGCKLSEFLKSIISVCGSIEQANEELNTNPPCMKFSKVKTKSGYWCVVFELVDETVPF